MNAGPAGPTSNALVPRLPADDDEDIGSGVLVLVRAPQARRTTSLQQRRQISQSSLPTRMAASPSTIAREQSSFRLGRSGSLSRTRTRLSGWWMLRTRTPTSSPNGWRSCCHRNGPVSSLTILSCQERWFQLSLLSLLSLLFCCCWCCCCCCCCWKSRTLQPVKLVSR